MTIRRVRPPRTVAYLLSCATCDHPTAYAQPRIAGQENVFGDRRLVGELLLVDDWMPSFAPSRGLVISASSPKNSTRPAVGPATPDTSEMDVDAPAAGFEVQRHVAQRVHRAEAFAKADGTHRDLGVDGT
jgi:hypothetical protein